MAGIGFELRRMIESEASGLFEKTKCYVSAALVSSGPWIMTIVTLSVLSTFGTLMAGQAQYELFRGVVTYAFAFSLVVVGVIQMAVTRRVADHLYSRQYKPVLPAFVACSVVTAAVQAVIGIVFCLVAGFGPALSVVSISLYVVISLSWIALVWLGITKEYDEVLRAYGLGTLVSLVAALLAGPATGAIGLLGAFTVGQGLTVVLLMRAIMRGMEAGGGRSFNILKSVRTFPVLVGIGVTYNLAIWIDKMLFWFIDGTGPHPLIRFHPLYDTCCFLAYLTVVPALAVNLVRVETSFYECYRAYFGAILGGMPLKVIDHTRKRMFSNLHEGMVRIIRLQGFITGITLMFAPLLIRWLELPESAIRVFRAACLGAFFHVLLLIVLLVQLYFDFRVAAFLTCLMFLVLNGSLGLWSISGGISTYGVGYALAALFSLAIGYVLLTKKIDRLNFMTFTGQPLSESDRVRKDED